MSAAAEPGVGREKRMTLKVYCEHGALTKDLRDLKRRGCIELIHFPYDPDGRTKHISATAVPSEAQWRDMNVTWDEARFSWEDCQGSEHFEEILRIIGTANRRDALHVDSAYKSGCACFVTEDRDILSKSELLGALLGLRFFHPRQHGSELQQFLGGPDKAP
jgi:hypothetical protein